jgi:hypothetical protein
MDIKKSFIKTKIKDFLNENLKNIEISKIEPDERRDVLNSRNKYHVNYQLMDGDNLIEIEGQLNPYHSGRAEEYEFEPTYFSDTHSEEYYDNNWERVEDEILDKFRIS